MENKDLSKLKYIYNIYTSQDRVVHCERYKVVYVNQEYVYYKVARKRELVEIKTEIIYDAFNKVEDLKVGSFWNEYSINQWFFEVNNFNSKETTDYIFKYERDDILTRATRNYNQSKVEYDKRKSELEKVRLQLGIKEKL